MHNIDINKSLAESLQENSLKLHKIMVWAAVVIVPGFSLLDFYLAPNHWAELIVLRLTVAVLCYLSLFLQKKFQLRSEVIAYTCCLGVFLFVNFLCMRVPADTMFLFHINSASAILGYSVLVLWHWKHYLITICVSLIAYLSFFVIFRSSNLGFIDTIVHGGAVYWIVAVLSIFLVVFRYNSFVNEFMLRHKLAISNQQIQEKNEELTIQQEEISKQNKELAIQQEEISEKNEELNQSNEELQTNMELVQMQNKQIQKHNEEVKASITYASRIQNALLPFQDRLKEYFNEDFFVLYKPRDIVSGDFYWCENINNSIIMAVADCTGHGVPGAFMSMLGSMGLNSVIFQENTFEADKILNKLHQYIFSALRQDKSDSRDGMDIALLVIHPSIKIVEYAGAMNPLYYIQKDTLITLKGDNKPIGGGQYGTGRNFIKTTIDTTLPTTFYLSSDGYQDQFGGKDKRKFMAGNFKKLLHTIHHETFIQQAKILEDTIESWMYTGGEKQIDDILVIGIRL
jgi:serine phosphatase RsbU (regulator of sigma subunit)